MKTEHDTWVIGPDFPHEYDKLNLSLVMFMHDVYKGKLTFIDWIVSWSVGMQDISYFSSGAPVLAPVASVMMWDVDTVILCELWVLGSDMGSSALDRGQLVKLSDTVIISHLSSCSLELNKDS